MVAQVTRPRLPLHERFFLRLSKGTRVDGLWVGACGNDAAEVSRVLSALSLIKMHDRRRYARITRDLERIWVLPLIGCAGDFQAAAMMCRIDNKHIANLSIEYVASVIVHEATHARLWNRRIGYPEGLRFRIERACMRQELVFARRLPNNSRVIDSIEARLLAALPDRWSDQALQLRFQRQAREKARDVGIPDWLTSLLMRLRPVVGAAKRWSTAK